MNDSGCREVRRGEVAVIAVNKADGRSLSGCSTTAACGALGHSKAAGDKLHQVVEIIIKLTDELDKRGRQIYTAIGTKLRRRGGSPRGCGNPLEKIFKNIK